MAEPRAAKLNALTSLRFVAAAMIVFHHSHPAFAKYDPFIRLAEDQGVSFFFVLSGFILSYVYPTLDSFKAIRHFIVARFARIWPAHIFAFILVLLVVPHQAWLAVPGSTTHGIRKALANICLVQAWIPKAGYYFSFNAPSWSISNEFFFYLCFPLLIHKWKYQWKVKLAGVFLVTFALIVFVQAMHFPFEDGSFSRVTIESLVYINPLARILEFTLGMTVYLAWEKLREVAMNRVWGTVLELLAIAIVAIVMIASHYEPPPYAGALRNIKWIGNTGLVALRNIKWIGNTSLVWYEKSGSLIFFALLILVMGLEKGFISKVLSMPFAVTLGEISYSVYLLHRPLFWFYYLHITSFSMLPDGLVYAVYWLLLLLMAHLVWRLIERPARKHLVELLAKTGAARAVLSQEQSAGQPIRSSKIGFFFTKRWLIAELLLLSGLIVVIAVLIHSPHSL